MFGPFVNHEYGFTLVQAGQLAEAEGVFGRMKNEGELPNRARGYRSLALLQMYRGQYGSAGEELRSAIVLDRTYKEPVSEFRDRMYLLMTLDARDQRREADAAWTEVDRLINRLSLDPSWLWQPVRRLARRGQLRDAQRLVALMEKTAGSATADGSVARNVGLDRAYIDAGAGRDRAGQRAIGARDRTARAHAGGSEAGDGRVPRGRIHGGGALARGDQPLRRVRRASSLLGNELQESGSNPTSRLGRCTNGWGGPTTRVVSIRRSWSYGRTATATSFCSRPHAGA